MRWVMSSESRSIDDIGPDYHRLARVAIALDFLSHRAGVRLYQSMMAELHFDIGVERQGWHRRERDYMMSRLTRAIVARLGDSVVFHRTRVFASAEVTVDITVDATDRMTLATRGLSDHGCAEVEVRCGLWGPGGIDFLDSIVRWLLADPERPLQTGDTVGRTGDEKVMVIREGELIRIDLP